MKKTNSFRFTYLLISVIAAVLSTSCGNVYEPLANGGTSDLDLVEKAQKCLKDNDYACAIAEYNQIQNPSLKTQKLCLAHLGQTGFTIPFLLDILKAGGTNMLGTLTKTRPAGFSTRAISAKNRSGSGRCSRVSIDTT